MNLQPTLANDLVRIVPLLSTDFDELFAIASDELLWEQHPDKDRYQKEVFLKFFEDAIQSNSAFKIIDVKNGKTIGSSRYYDFNESEKSVAIGYTFIDRNYWATPYNRALKNLMINYAFQFMETIIFHVGETNFRSRKAVEKLGAVLSETVFVEATQRTHVVYKLDQKNWL